jgi:hypothetical protein
MSQFSTLWTLHRGGGSVSAELCDRRQFGLELRYVRNGQPFATALFEDGADLLCEAAVWRFELEAAGWSGGRSKLTTA